MIIARYGSLESRCTMKQHHLFRLLALVSLLTMLSTTNAEPWTRRFLSGYTKTESILCTPDSGFLLLSNSYFVYDPIILDDTQILRVDRMGNIIWSVHPSFPFGYLFDATQLPDSTYLCVGRTPDSTLLIVQYNSVGDTVHTWHYEFLSHTGFKIIPADGGGYLIAGLAFQTIPFLMKIDSNLDSVWYHTYPNYEAQQLYRSRPSLIKTSNNCCLLVYTHQTAMDSLFPCVIKINSEGAIEFSFIYSIRTLTTSHTNETLFDAFGCDDGGLLACGKSGNVGFIFRLNSEGRMLWSRVPYSIGSSTISSCVESNQHFYFTGYYSFGDSTKSFVGNVDRNGSSDSITRLHTTYLQTVAQKMTLSLDGGYAVSGAEASINGSCIFIEKIDVIPNSAAPEPTSPSIPESYSFHCFPNPFNSSTHISFTLIKPGLTTICLYDATGRLVKTLSDGFFPAGTHSTTLNGSELPSGIYFCRMSNNGAAFTRKIALVK